MERLVVAAVIVNDEGRAFVHRRSPDRALFPNCWDVPGGHVEEGETPQQALDREVCEETGWRVRRILAELGEMRWVGNDGVARRELDYLIEVTGDLASPRLERPRHVEFDWVGTDDLERLMEEWTPPDADIRDLVRRGLREAARRAIPQKGESELSTGRRYLGRGRC